MRYMTDRKRATGLGASKTGTAHHYGMQMSSFALVPLCLIFVFQFGSALGGSYEDVVSYYSRPWPAFVAGLTFWVGLMHFKNGAKMMIEDYVHGFKGRVAYLVASWLAYGIAATATIGLVKLALQ